MATVPVRDALRFGWKTTKENLGLLICVTLVSGVIVMGPTFALGFVYGLRAEMADPQTSTGIDMLLAAPGYIAMGILMMGYLRIALRLVDGETARFRDLFSCIGMFPALLVAAIVFDVLVLLGFVALVIPAVIINLKLFFFAFVLVDRGVGPIQSLKQSWAMTRGVKLSLFYLWFWTSMVYTAGALACGVGVLVTLPVAVLATAYVYRQLAPDTAAEEAVPA